MAVLIPKELEDYAQQKVESGEFESKEAFVAEAMRLYREMESRHDALRRDVQHGVDQLDRGEGIRLEGDEQLDHFFEDIKARGRARRSARTDA
jgi:antitoxin ParD1/3/4